MHARAHNGRSVRDLSAARCLTRRGLIQDYLGDRWNTWAISDLLIGVPAVKLTSLSLPARPVRDYHSLTHSMRQLLSTCSRLRLWDPQILCSHSTQHSAKAALLGTQIIDLHRQLRRHQLR